MKLFKWLFGGSKYRNVRDRGKGVAIIGSGSWATAVAKIVLAKEDEITWCFRRQEAIDAFKRTGRNPDYLSQVPFDVDCIHFTRDINEAIATCHTIIFATPSPYLKPTLKDLEVEFKGKLIIFATKGIVPDENLILTDYFEQEYKVRSSNMCVLSGPSHAEEVAMDRITYLTVACNDLHMAEKICERWQSDVVRFTPSNDVRGIEIAGVLKNIYSVAAGVCHGLGYGDNFQAVLMSTAAREMQRVLAALNGVPRNICDNVYLGDLLVTGYSNFSRNRQFGTMLAQGYSIKAAQTEMKMVAEGYFGTACMMKMNKTLHVPTPIVDTVYNILYRRVQPREAIERMTQFFGR